MHHRRVPRDVPAEVPRAPQGLGWIGIQILEFGQNPRLQCEKCAKIPRLFGEDGFRRGILQASKAARDADARVEVLQRCATAELLCKPVGIARQDLIELKDHQMRSIETQRPPRPQAVLGHAAILHGEVYLPCAVGVCTGRSAATEAGDAGAHLAVEAPALATPAHFHTAQGKHLPSRAKSVALEKEGARLHHSFQGKAGRKIARVGERWQ